MKTALVIVDIQKDYFPGGRMELVGALEASKSAGRLLSAFREKGLPVIHVQHIAAREGATFFIPGTKGVEIHANVAPGPDEAIIKKNYPNSFRGTELGGTLEKQGVEELVICGMMSHMCIDATVRAAFDIGYRCLVAHDACATRNLVFGGIEVPAGSVHASFMAALGQVYATLMKTDEVVSMLQESGGF